MPAKLTSLAAGTIWRQRPAIGVCGRAAPPARCGRRTVGGGAGVARGYHNRPDLTAEKFIPNPFGDEPGLRLYRTGDRGAYLPDGQLNFIGRTDEQVKVRGFRIEPGEIEAVLSSHAGVKTCVVVAREEALGEKRLVAYVVGERGSELHNADLSAHLKERLPEYMVPAAFVMLESLPLSPNSKFDRRALPAPAPAKRATQTAAALPRTTLEKVLTRLWCEILARESAGPDDNFFESDGWCDDKPTAMASALHRSTLRARYLLLLVEDLELDLLWLRVRGFEFEDEGLLGCRRGCAKRPESRHPQSLPFVL